MKNGIDQKNVIAKFSPSKIYALIIVSPFLLLSTLAIIVSIIFYPILIFLGIVLSFMAWVRYISVIYIKYTLTVETLTVRTGIISRQFNNLELYRVKDYIVTQSVSERLFGLMTVTLITNDITNPTVKLQGILVSNITKTIRDLVQKARNNNRILEIN
ncbi:PH domain-containing protein [Sphingobacterium sp.]|uniref:PH domain-containing protein n=1 Tax=Sphingobacterium sp. TaxID=341027 RepID=UPI0028AFCAD9|nr:PH domain-containing protein [Sphingobacterium sp.]